MRAEYSSLSKSVRSLHQLRPTREDFERFKANLATLIAKTEEAPKKSNSGALEKTEKGLLKDFLRDTFYSHLHVGNLNYKGNTGADLLDGNINLGYRTGALLLRLQRRST